MSQEFSLSKQSESNRLSFYGALFAIAAADGSIDIEESSTILKSINFASLSGAAKQQIQVYMQDPPSLENCLEQLQGSDTTLRWGLLFYLIYVAWIDRNIKPEEEQAISLAKEKFGVMDSQVTALRMFIKQMTEIRDSQLSSKEIKKASKAAIADLTKQEVPILKIFTSMGLEQTHEGEDSYTEEGLWKKLRNFAAVVGKEVVEKALLLFYAAQQPNVPLQIKSTIFAALGYFILPLDAIPDVIPGVGFGDDFTALATALVVCAFYITPEVKEKARQKIQDWFGGSVAS